MSQPRPSRVDPAIVAALIGVCGTIMVTVLSLLAPRFMADARESPTPLIGFTPEVATATITFTPVPTDTVPVGEPTSTPAPDTPTPIPPTFTFTPAAPAIGADWLSGCVSELWQPYPDTVFTTVNNGCRSEPVNLFFAADGRLSFLAADRYPDTQVYGMFAPVPANSVVNISTFLRDMKEGEIWVGVFAEPDVNSQGMILVIPAGDITNRPVIQKSMPGQNEIQSTASFQRIPALYDFTFDIANGGVSAIILRDTVFNAVPVTTDQPWLFVGYQVKKGNNRLDAEFLSLSVQPR